ncbi:hypothetical protein [Granulicoccus phenolivorans]|uniref:hypothetical protein n=1 Tax=Granulicoccus phenolivorans TaxID=266854 RepID=UPI0004095FFA|nr:hypothetical protein [Granulicoccus phenolivorans]
MIAMLTAFDFLTGLLVAAPAVVGAGALWWVGRALARRPPALAGRSGPLVLAGPAVGAPPALVAGRPVTADPEDNHPGDRTSGADEITRDLSADDAKNRNSSNDH